MTRFTRLTNVSSISVAIPDLGVHLAGRGSEATVDSEAAKASEDLKSCAFLVSSSPIVVEKKMPLWPFHRPAPPPVSPPPRHDRQSPLETLEAQVVPHVPPAMPPTQPFSDAAVLHEIRDLLQALVSRQTPFLPASSLPASSGPAAPMFIPESIIPRDAEVKISAMEGTVRKPDFDEAKAALAKARRR